MPICLHRHKNMDLLSEDYWSDKYEKEQTAWDIGHVSTPLKAYIDQLENKSLKILIPGAGNSYEAEYLFNQGFHNVFVMDVSELPLGNLKNRVPNFPQKNLLLQDFFKHTGQYDLILEQTFFCALDPKLREIYSEQMVKLLKPTGKLVGLLFNIPLFEDHPPFGGDKTEYEHLFKERFAIEVMEDAYNSIPPRQGNELFVKMSKK